MQQLWLDFLNSYYEDWRGSGRTVDRLDEPEAVQAFLLKWGLPLEPLTHPQFIPELKALRQYLTYIVRYIVEGHALKEEDILHLNELLRAGPVVRQLVPEIQTNQKFESMSEVQVLKIGLIPVGDDFSQLKAELTASFIQVLVDGERGRIKICENTDCKWVFYDDTKNKSKRYCSDKTCGNLMKVRRHRARNKKTT